MGAFLPMKPLLLGRVGRGGGIQWCCDSGGVCAGQKSGRGCQARQATRQTSLVCAAALSMGQGFGPSRHFLIHPQFLGFLSNLPILSQIC